LKRSWLWKYVNHNASRKVAAREHILF
jgi:hypothetical protein